MPFVTRVPVTTTVSTITTSSSTSSTTRTTQSGNGRSIPTTTNTNAGNIGHGSNGNRQGQPPHINMPRNSQGQQQRPIEHQNLFEHQFPYQFQNLQQFQYPIQIQQPYHPVLVNGGNVMHPPNVEMLFNPYLRTIYEANSQDVKLPYVNTLRGPIKLTNP